jgi:hypothetical protein
MYRVKRKGPTTDPCGTPTFNVETEDDIPWQVTE